MKSTKVMYVQLRSSEIGEGYKSTVEVTEEPMRLLEKDQGHRRSAEVT